MHHIKKYANRKMYDAKTKSYVTIEDIARLVESGEQITIIDNTSGEDITQDVISQLVGRVLDGQARKLPTSVLVQLVRKGSGGLVDFSKKYVSFWQNALNFAGDELDKVNTLIGRETPSAGTGTAIPAIEDIPEKLARILEARIEEQCRIQVKKQRADIEQQLDDLQKELAAVNTRLETVEKLLLPLMKIDEDKLPKT